ncbi:efflux RND transporter permease subunit [Arcobacter porcinus]|uniref:RND family efflux system, inner membrane transporter, AcrB family n=1 Tax=Arcobacter porcinus TaxID=1935204 RepID=A0A5C2HIX2_9BACT|nr:efflux RND transporter permease subunit [Arcobacter porcinus]OCL82571.1 Multidrug resistance protein MdtB [Arcobacter porcinus]OCL87298.1 Multidrug resistance protein MdtB [Arcobacter porcinus]OCL91427.1 Multidrug resistance protein MdtB [Aliarcobacter thereius]QEP40258.1 RND family efflux system, inner membrane transporter, AcrB family [Arcobacter porcinus]
MNRNLNIAGRIAQTFINHPLTFILALFILILGYFSLLLMPKEENPQIKVSGGVVIVALPDAKASEIQKVIIEPLEKKIKEIKGVEHIFSFARDSVGIVQVQFFIGEDKEQSNLKLYDQVMRNMDLMPKNAMQPIIKTMDIDTGIPIATIAFYSEKKDGIDILNKEELYEEVSRIAKKINKIEDVAMVDLKGEKKEQYNIEVDINRLNSYNIALAYVKKQVEALNFNTPNMSTNTSDNSLVVMQIEQAITSVKDLENLIISYNFSTPIYLKDIAKITKSYEIQNKKDAYLYTKKDDGTFEEYSQITLMASKLKGANSVTINEKIFEYMDSIKEPLLSKNIKYVITRDDGYSANIAVNSLIKDLITSIIIIFILLIFTLGFKEALIVSLTVPMILSLTLFIGFLLGETVNRITLFALIVSLGMLVDAAIIVIENIHRHKVQNPHLDIEQIAINATNEIGNPTNIATIAIVLVFVPMFFVGGMMGEFMHPLPVFVPISLIVSLFVAYAFTPYLVRKILKVKK